MADQTPDPWKDVRPRHLCQSCGLDDEQWAWREGFNAAVALALKARDAERQERDEAVGRLLNRAGLAACGHYAVFTLMTVFEDGAERPTCMQCDRDAAQDRAVKAEAERDALTQEIATLREDLDEAKRVVEQYESADQDRAWRIVAEFMEERNVSLVLRQRALRQKIEALATEYEASSEEDCIDSDQPPASVAWAVIARELRALLQKGQ